MRILVVDDDVDIRRLLRFLLEELGATVVEAANGREALDRLDEAGIDGVRFDGAVLDFSMPGMNGAELADSIAQRPGHVPVVFVTGERDPVLLGELAARGRAVLSKPVDVMDVAGRILGLLGAPGVDGASAPVSGG